MNRPEAIRTFFRSSANSHGASSNTFVDSPSSIISQQSMFDQPARPDTLSKIGVERLHSQTKSNQALESNNLSVQRGLFQLVQHFLDKKDGRPTAADTQNKERVYERCKSNLRSNPRPSTTQDEMHIAGVISRKLSLQSGSNSKQLRFETLLNKLMDQNAVKNKWAILYLLNELSEDNDDMNYRSRNRMPSSAQSIDSFASQGLPTLTPPHQHTLARTYDGSDSSRSIRRKVSDESDASMDHNLPPAQQLQVGLRTHEAEFSSKQVPEPAILRDIMFIFQGIDGTYIKFDSETDAYVIDNMVGISRSARELIHKLTELGWLYKRIQNFISTNIDNASIGLVGQSFCSSLQREMNDYYKLIAVLEAQISKSEGRDPAFLSDELDTSLSTKSLTLKRLIVWMRDSLQRLRLMSVLIDACQDQKGGAFVSVIHNYTKHGDPFIQKFISQLLEEVSAPFWEMLRMWIYEGELEDPYEEFFVGCDESVSEEELWQKKYSFREGMLPSFISNTLAQKIFSIGKSLNFIRYNCHESSVLQENSQGHVQTLRYGNISAVESSIDTAYLDTSRKLLNILKDKFRLMEHLKAFKRYLLLSQGDFIQYLLDTLGSGLSKPANTLFRHNLTGVLEAAIRASNAQYDDPSILARLDVRLLEISPQDLGWDVFTLDYHVDSPINTIFTPQAMQQYLKMFNFLWRLKRVEHSLSAAWRGLVTSGRQYNSIPELARDIRSAQIVITSMIHFTSQLQYYYLFEVLECSWKELSDFIENKCIDLDSLIDAHSRYLTDITTKGFLNGSRNQNMLLRLFKILDTALQYRTSLDQLIALADYEFIRRDANRQSGVDTSKLAKIRMRLTSSAESFQRETLDLLATLSSYQDDDLRSLSTRLDYNDFYGRSTATSRT
ncbi:Spc98 family-domain-containing protein [Umbelopsis sp. PMI_123]|nr:Spc98 family-domain-containing protein [Umbelopsis sp. PMI_123]